MLFPEQKVKLSSPMNYSKLQKGQFDGIDESVSKVLSLAKYVHVLKVCASTSTTFIPIPPTA